MADISSPGEFIQEAINAVSELNNDKTVLNGYKDSQKSLDMALSQLKKNIEKEKATTISSRRGEYESEFNKQIKALESEIKSINDKRQKARSQGVKVRIDEQIKPYQDEIKFLKTQLAKLVSDSGLSGICRTRLFYSLFMPSGLGEWFRLIVLILICLVAPYLAACLITQNHILRYVIAIAVIMLIVIIYVAVSVNAKGRNPQAAMQGRGIVNNIKADEKQIKLIRRNISRDKDDSFYDLREFDDELAQKNQERENVVRKKEEGLSQFDAVTKNVLCDEIDARFAEKLNETQTGFNEITEKVKELSSKVSTEELWINNSYSQYIGTRNLEPATLEKLKGFIDSGEAQSVSDAVAKLTEKPQQ